MLGVGGETNAPFPVEVKYHFKVPVVEGAINAGAISFWQYVNGLFTDGANGVGLTKTSICVLPLSQPFTVWLTK